MLCGWRQKSIREASDCRHAGRVWPLVDDGGPALVGFYDRLAAFRRGDEPRDVGGKSGTLDNGRLGWHRTPSLLATERFI
jgi:hypothetical protein